MEIKIEEKPVPPLQDLSTDAVNNLGTYLAGFLTPRRVELIDRVIANRTRKLALVLEDVYQPHNASAVLRTAECHGVLPVHVIQRRNRFNPNNTVSLGAEKWLEIERYRGEEGLTACYSTLRERGYRLVAMALNDKAITPDELDLDQPQALVFGTEETGLSEQALAGVDQVVQLPMYGFTQSYNISVSVAICLSLLVPRLRCNHSWALSTSESIRLRLNYFRATLGRADEYIWNWLEKNANQCSREMA